MQIRKLEIKDAPLMLEWMHDESVTRDLKKDFSSLTIEDAKSFIRNSLDDKENLNMAIVNDEDEYMGTVSLKHIRDGRAEFGIAIRKCAMGKGYSSEAMKQILSYGIDVLGLDSVFWCVDPVNGRAVRFYDKNGYQRVPADSLNLGQDSGYSDDEISRFVWYDYTR